MNKECFQESSVGMSVFEDFQPWKNKKIDSLLLSYLYRSVDVNKSCRIENCATFLRFCFDETNSNKLRLKSGNFCRVRLCPMCIWRRSLKIFSQVKKLVEAIHSEYNYEYLFLTLTVKNCDGRVLSSEIDKMMKAWKSLLREFKGVSFLKGWYRSLEITYNSLQNTYHPHFHCILVVDRSYFAWKNYISQEGWTNRWKKALGVNYIPVVNVKKTYGDVFKSVSEIAKYSVKSSEYIKKDNLDLSEKIIDCLDKALSHRRLISFGGIFRYYHKKLNLSCVDEDLIIENDRDDSSDFFGYEWDEGFQEYKMIID